MEQNISIEKFRHLDLSFYRISITYPADRGCTRISHERHGHLPRKMRPHLRVMRSSSKEDARSP
jgi:hypothetical protein